MKFKNKIIISFCIIIFVPIFLATLVLFSMQHIQMRAIEQTYGVEGDGYSYFSNSVQLLSRFTREIYRKYTRWQTTSRRNWRMEHTLRRSTSSWKKKRPISSFGKDRSWYI